ncbi:pectate lyase [Pedobacter sp. ISL-68]|uniref:pectate lyase family protein n=1 Tax=unclassified Pedobacter TaxID=2628915 RepID=UPI001BEAC39C|nr:MULTISPECIES: pectate lyase [unclassified Pedobacter]MBT2561448.1 pectate lyase [Pedobacter sp. ISL-64]MBT2590837.1 pectate lyase [Pedobacter sp. ISL-68]
MQRKTKLFKKVSLIGLMLTTIIFFSNCKKSVNADDKLADSTELFSSDSASVLAAISGSTGKLSLIGVKSEGGYAYKISQSISGGDNATSKEQSILRLFENGVELGPAHSIHDDIRNLGKGRFSHWGTTVIFSASDNTDPRTNGRSYTYVMGGTSAALPPAETVTPPPTNTTINAALVGYALVNGKTTGGQGGVETTVTTLDQLKAAVGDNITRTIYVSGTIKGAGKDIVYVKSNKSIIGRSGAVIEGVNLFIYTVSNIIIQNITFKNYVEQAAVQIKEAAHHVWVDHCDFSTDRTHGWEYWGKDITITRESDYVTVSWSKFHDTNLSVLISGGIEGHEADKGKLHVTMHHNMWYNVTEREPSMNYGSVHMFNNYHLNNSGYSIGTRAGGIVRTDNEYFSNCAKPLTTKVASDPEGYFSGITTNIYDKCGANNITTAVSSWVPEYEYASFLNDAASVPAIVTANAGAR